jgi:hypothetical protein
MRFFRRRGETAAPEDGRVMSGCVMARAGV